MQPTLYEQISSLGAEQCRSDHDAGKPDVACTIHYERAFVKVLGRLGLGRLSFEEANRRLYLCPDCLHYDGAHDPICDNEEAQRD